MPKTELTSASRDAHAFARSSANDNCDMLEHALYYAAEKHWPIFPCKRDKTPLTSNGALDATTNKQQIERWWRRWPNANIGLDVGGAGMMALDLDPGHDLQELERNVGKLPDTKLRQKTPRGGEHLFYALAEGEVVAHSASKLAKHVDVRSFHSYVLLAPSETDDGCYRLSDKGTPAFRTDEMVRLANSAKDKHQDRDNWLIEPDLPEHLAKAADWLANTAKPAIEGEGGDHRTYATAAMCKSFGIGQDKALELMLEHWNARCDPPWEAEDLEVKVENAYSYNTSPPGNMTDAYAEAKNKELFKPVERPLGEGRKIDDGKFRIVDRAGMEGIKPPTWLIEDFLPENAYAIMFGAPGTFKTFVALDIALSIATGNQDTWKALGQGNVLFAAGEARSGIPKRVRAWEALRNAGKRATGFHLIDPVPNAGLVTDTKQFVERALDLSSDGYKLIVLDTIGRAMQGLNENAQQDASRLTQMVEAIQRGTNATVLALAHVGYENNKRLRGSSVYEADADMLVRLDREAKTQQVSLQMVKQKEADPWEHPKLLSLIKTKDSLSVTKPDPATAQAPEAQAKLFREAKAKAERGAQTTKEIIADEVIAFFGRMKGKDFTTNALAETLSFESERIEIGAKQTKRYIEALRDEKHSKVRKYFDGIHRRWRWRP